MNDVHLITVQVNGERREVAVEARRTLADVLRHDLGYTGTHLGCEHGICGACTVLVDGEPTRACLVFGVQADDCEIETVEGLADGDEPQHAPGGVRGQPRPAVRLLHARVPDARDRAAAREPRPERRGDPRGDGVEPVPLHRLPGRSSRPSAQAGRRAPGGLSGGGAPPRGRPPAARRRALRRRRRPPGAAVDAGRALVRRARAARWRSTPSGARELPGVHAVLSAADLPDLPSIPVRLGPFEEDLDAFLQPVLARDRVRYVGEPVAVVCAEDPYLAEDAEELVAVEYEELEPVLDALAGEPCTVLRRGFGDVGGAFAEAARVVALEVQVGRHCAVPLETRGLVAEHHPATASPSGARRRSRTSTAASWPPRSACRRSTFRSGARTPAAASACAGSSTPRTCSSPYLARALGRPVKWIEDRAEHLVATNHSREQRHRLEAAFDEEGRLLALRDELWHDNGAYLRTHGVVVPELTLSDAARALPRAGLRGHRARRAHEQDAVRHLPRAGALRGHLRPRAAARRRGRGAGGRPPSSCAGATCCGRRSCRTSGRSPCSATTS